ncbi:MAG: hypothetical protein GF364_06755, partial [Candidatus Lokiarchaeota archaeon]|nr:hypothetical protein [Candidatus Lokiarchaeota archaeon]
MRIKNGKRNVKITLAMIFVALFSILSPQVTAYWISLTQITDDGGGGNQFINPSIDINKKDFTYVSSFTWDYIGSEYDDIAISNNTYPIEDSFGTPILGNPM